LSLKELKRAKKELRSWVVDNPRNDDIIGALFIVN
jgi:hypothetical protein